MGAIVKMKKKIRCFSLQELVKMQGIKIIDPDKDNLLKVFEEYNVEVFQPYYSKITSGPTRRPGMYVTTNKEFDKWVKQQNLLAVLKGFPMAKVKYKEFTSRPDLFFW